MENTCRLCLLQSPEIVEELWEGCDILDKLSVSLSHYVSLADELPKKICYACINKVDDIYKFHQKISQNEIILQKRLDNIICNNLKDNAIKKENTYNDENYTDYIESSEIDKPIEEINIKPVVFQCRNNVNECITPKYKSNIDNLNNSNEIKIEVMKENFESKCNVNSILVKSLKNNEEQAIKEIKFEESKRFTCLTCFEVFCNQLELLRHYQTVELEKFNKNNTTNENELITYKVQESDDGALVYKCERCCKKYRNKTGIKRHVASHVETRPFLCKLCGKTYQTASIIVAHGKMHTGEMYKCSYNCGYRSVHKHVVKDHEKRHRKEYKYKCEACGKGFQVKTWYEQHQNIHKGVKPFSCEICGMTFHLHKYLTTHRSNVHPQSSGRKPWICKLCSLPCDSKNTLNLHLKEKHGVITKISILCDICGKVVRNTQQLKQHKRAVHLHIKPYVCSVCNKSFPKKFTLTVHEQTHTRKRYSCNFCEKMFSRKSSLQRHISRFHLDSKLKCSQCEKTFTSKVKLATHKEVCSENVKPPTKIQENNIKV